MYSEELKIPKERVAVLIGKNGGDKKLFEKELGVKIKVDSEGAVIISGEDSLNLRTCADIVKAIGRGFNPHISKLLLNEEYGLEVIDMTDYTGKSKEKLIRLRARCIGTEGKARKTIETLTKTNVSIFGKTIAIIGEVEAVIKAKIAFENILRGSKHGHTYAILEKNQKKHKF